MMRYFCMVPGAEFQITSRKVFTTKNTKKTQFRFCRHIGSSVIARGGDHPLIRSLCMEPGAEF
jgi:hypothetical protein